MNTNQINMGIFNRQINGDLIYQVKCTSAKTYKFMIRQLFEHSEYNTEWSSVASDWVSKGYCKHIKISEYEGHEDVIFELLFMNADKSDAFINEIKKYFNTCDYVSDYIYCVTHQKVIDFTNQ